MELFRRPKKKNVVDEPQGLIVPASKGDTLLEFPGDVVKGLRHLVTRMNQRRGLPKRLSMIAALREEGVSYLSQALAATIASDLNLQVCLVDLNFWWPADLFRVSESQPSLSQVISGRTSLDKALTPTGWKNLTILPAGNVPKHSRPMVSNSQALKDIIEILNTKFDHLILDIPAILATTDSVSLASLGDAACLVIQQGTTYASDVSQALDEVEHMEMMGTILNRVKLATPERLIRLLSI